MSVAALIRGVRPKNAAKWLEGELPDCSPRQAWRIVQTGKVPGRFRAALIRVLDDAIASNKAQLDRLQDELTTIRYAEVAARAEDRRSATARQDIQEAAGHARRAKASEPVARDAR